MTAQFTSSLHHIRCALSRIDALIHAQVRWARAGAAADDPYRGLYIGEEDVDRLIRAEAGLPDWLQTIDPHEVDAIHTASEEMARKLHAAAVRTERDGAEMRLTVDSCAVSSSRPVRKSCDSGAKRRRSWSFCSKLRANRLRTRSTEGRLRVTS